MGTCSFCGRISGQYTMCIDCKHMLKDGLLIHCNKCHTLHPPNEECANSKHLICDICQKKCTFPDLCDEHLDMLGKDILKCKKCGTYHFKNRSCPTCYITKYLYNVSAKETAWTNCIICNSPSKNGQICDSCENKYSNKTLMYKIENGHTITLLDERYEGVFPCTDGHLVKSQAEQNIDNFFFDNRIRHIYEPEILTNDGSPIHPDFYLPDLKVYIEHWGFGNSYKNYTQKKNFKMKFYRENNISLICMYSTDQKDIKASLFYKLKNFKKGQINFEKD